MFPAIASYQLPGRDMPLQNLSGGGGGGGGAHFCNLTGMWNFPAYNRAQDTSYRKPQAKIRLIRLIRLINILSSRGVKKNIGNMFIIILPMTMCGRFEEF